MVPVSRVHSDDSSITGGCVGTGGGPSLPPCASPVGHRAFSNLPCFPAHRLFLKPLPLHALLPQLGLCHLPSTPLPPLSKCTPSYRAISSVPVSNPARVPQWAGLSRRLAEAVGGELLPSSLGPSPLGASSIPALGSMPDAHLPPERKSGFQGFQGCQAS